MFFKALRPRMRMDFTIDRDKEDLEDQEHTREKHTAVYHDRVVLLDEQTYTRFRHTPVCLTMYQGKNIPLGTERYTFLEHARVFQPCIFKKKKKKDTLDTDSYTGIIHARVLDRISYGYLYPSFAESLSFISLTITSSLFILFHVHPFGLITYLVL